MFLLCQSSAGAGSGKGIGTAGESAEEIKKAGKGTLESTEDGRCVIERYQRKSAGSKSKDPQSCLPASERLVRSAMLETKEKTSIMADKIGRETGEESPVEYAGNRIERVEQRAGKESAFAAYRGGKKLAVKTYEKLKEQRQKQREAVTALWTGKQETAEHLPRQDRQEQRKGAQEPDGASRSNRKRRKRSRKPETGQ